MNVTFIEVQDPIANTSETYAIIDRGNGEYISMLKSTYDEMVATQENATPIL
jgi:hypothetical protein